MRATRLQVLIVSVLAFALAGCAFVVRSEQPRPAAPVSAPVGQGRSILAAQGSPEESIQAVIERGNAQQEQAIASRDSSLMRDTSTDPYFQDMVQTNQNLLNSGVTAIRLVNIEWGPIVVSGDTATATTYETWSSQFADGTTERSRDRNVYTLVQQDGTWRIQADEHPDDVVTTAPGGPRSTSPAPPSDGSSPSTSPAPPLVPRGRGQSSNWAGYVARGGGFTSVTGTWSVPQPAAGAGNASDAAWVGIGGETTRDLIQAGTQQTTVGSGQVQYSAWIETLPQASRTIPLAVHPGDSVTVSITEQQPGSWQVEFQNNSTGGSYGRTVQYSSSRSSAEWIEEAPSGRRGIVPLADFGSITFSGATAVKQGATINLSQASARPITMINGSNQPIAIPSAVAADGAGFTVTRTDNSATGDAQAPA
jgi:Peptidase A4 family